MIEHAMSTEGKLPLPYRDHRRKRLLRGLLPVFPQVDREGVDVFPLVERPERRKESPLVYGSTANSSRCIFIQTHNFLWKHPTPGTG